MTNTQASREYDELQHLAASELEWTILQVAIRQATEANQKKEQK